MYTAEASDGRETIVNNSQNMMPEDFLEANLSMDFTAMFVGTQVCVPLDDGHEGSPDYTS